MRDILITYLRNDSMFTGERISSGECLEILERFAPLDCSWVATLMALCRVSGTTFSNIHRERDPSIESFDFRWLSPKEIIDEAFGVFPGIAAIKAGYVPVGECLIGTGNPYFLQVRQPDRALYEIRHDAVDTDNETLLPGACSILVPDILELLRFVNVSA